jgi:hypothetical protein
VATSAIGRHCWRIFYLGDGFYEPANATNGDAACLTAVGPPVACFVTVELWGDTDSNGQIEPDLQAWFRVWGRDSAGSTTRTDGWTVRWDTVEPTNQHYHTMHRDTGVLTASAKAGPVNGRATLTQGSSQMVCSAPVVVQTTTITGVNANPQAFWPRPGNPGTRTTQLGFTLDRAARAVVEVHRLELDASGQPVRNADGTLVSRGVVRTVASFMNAYEGANAVTWNGKDNQNNYVGPSLYGIKVSALDNSPWHNVGEDFRALVEVR